MPLNTSTVVVLGGTSGIGLATAKAAAARGARVVVASRSQSRVEAALAVLPQGSAGYAVDVAVASAVQQLFTEVGPFDHFVYTAADNMAMTYLKDFTAERFAEFMSLRLVAALAALRAAVEQLQPGGSVTLTSGTAAFRAGPGWVLGAMASGAIISAVRALALELAPIRVNAVAPGVVRSPLWEQMQEADRTAMYEGLRVALPLGRVAEVEDVAKAYVALMEQDYATGTVAVVDGGTLLV